MATTHFDREAKAAWYAHEHRAMDPGIVSIYYVPENASDREVRLIEVNELLGDRTDEVPEPIELGVGRGSDDEHLLSIIDVTPAQWSLIKSGKLSLPADWGLAGLRELNR